LKGGALTLSPQGPITRAFLLDHPARAVFDLSGAPPARSVTLSTGIPHATAIRLGKQGAGTRLVVDLDALPKSSKQVTSGLVLSY
jgi:hypothetical protein